MKLRVLVKLTPKFAWLWLWLGLIISFSVTAELVTHRNYYSIQVMSGSPAAIKPAWRKLQGQSFARIEDHSGQHKLRFGFWSDKSEAEKQLNKIRIQFPDAFLLFTEYQPNKIVVDWSEKGSQFTKKPVDLGQKPKISTSGVLNPHFLPSNIVSATEKKTGVLNEEPSISSNIVSIQQTLQPGLSTIYPSNIIDQNRQAQVEPDVPPISLVEEIPIDKPPQKKQPAKPNEAPLWKLLHAEQYEALQAKIKHLRASHRQWNPPQELVRLLQQGQLQHAVNQAIQHKDTAALIQLGEVYPEDFSCSHVDWAWALAEAQSIHQQTDMLRLNLHRLISYCDESDRLATLYKAKSWLSADHWEILLESEAQAKRSAEGESKFHRLRYDDGMEKLLTAYRAQDQSIFRKLLQQLTDDIDYYRDADAAILSGWHYFNAQEIPSAEQWFNKALIWKPGLPDAYNGLALSALQNERFADAKRYAEALPDGNEGKEELLRTLSIAMRPKPRVLAMAGGETNTSINYSAAYAGFIMPIHSRLGVLGNGIVQRLWLDRMTYSYFDGNQNTHAEQLGIEGSLGYQKSGPWGSWAVFAGAVYRDTRFSPDTFNNPARGGFVRARFQIEGERMLSPNWRMNINANYVTGQDSYWTRGRLLYNLNERYLTGPEVIVLGDPNFQIRQYGWALMGLRAFSGTDVTIRSGARDAVDGTSMYFGLELARPF